MNEDVVQKMKSIDIVKDTERMIRQSLNTVEFGSPLSQLEFMSYIKLRLR